MARTKKKPPLPAVMGRGRGFISRTSTPIVSRGNQPAPSGSPKRSTQPSNRGSPSPSPYRRSRSLLTSDSHSGFSFSSYEDSIRTRSHSPQSRAVGKSPVGRPRSKVIRPQQSGPSSRPSSGGNVRGGRGRGRGGQPRIRGWRAIKEIKKYQKSTNLLIRCLPFARVVREVANQVATDNMRWTGTALLALQEATEAYLVQFFEDANAAAINSNRVTIMRKDMMLTKNIRRDPFTEW